MSIKKYKEFFFFSNYLQWSERFAREKVKNYKIRASTIVHVLKAGLKSEWNEILLYLCLWSPHA